MSLATSMPAVEVVKLGNYLGGVWVHRDLDLTIAQGESIGIAGGSGSGKSTLLRTMLGLQKPCHGEVKLMGSRVDFSRSVMSPDLRQHVGVMFQSGALFTSLTVLQNVAFPLQLNTNLKSRVRDELAFLKLKLVGLPNNVAHKYPAELSGGMIKRVAVARALVMDPAILFLDEPNAGLDPHGAHELDTLIIQLRLALNLTVVLVTHDPDTLCRVVDKVAFLGDGRILSVGDVATLQRDRHSKVSGYFNNSRVKAALIASEQVL